MVVQEFAVAFRAAIYLQTAKFGVSEFGSIYGTLQEK
jgi:hypothetical protein|tara:strand:+ start:19 stop:129 length:111 start_codon:yes stop_codon:yes gene_type:complete